jgi:hypothetical protein
VASCDKGEPCPSKCDRRDLENKIMEDGSLKVTTSLKDTRAAEEVQ